MVVSRTYQACFGSVFGFSKYKLSVSLFLMQTQRIFSVSFLRGQKLEAISLKVKVWEDQMNLDRILRTAPSLTDLVSLFQGGHCPTLMLGDCEKIDLRARL